MKRKSHLKIANSFHFSLCPFDENLDPKILAEAKILFHFKLSRCFEIEGLKEIDDNEFITDLQWTKRLAKRIQAGR